MSLISFARSLRGPVRRLLLQGGCLGALAVLVAGCSVFEKASEPLPCPQVLIDRDTVQVTRFRSSGQDLTDMELEAEIIGYTGECSVDRETNVVDMTLQLSFLAKLGPAAPQANEDGVRTAAFEYYVALPDFYPHPAGKQVFTTDIGFPANVNQVRFRDSNVKMTIPLAPDVNSGDAKIYVGMQVTEDQLDYNRKNRPKY